MGFSLGKAITGALGGAGLGALLAAPTGGLSLLAGAGLGALAGGGISASGMMDSEQAKVSFANIPETDQAKLARAQLYGLATGEPPKIPKREIAPLKPMGEERTTARETAKELIQPADFFQLPEVQGIIQEAMRKGNLLANRLGRMLQASGNLTSTTGRDVLGRAVTDVQKNLASSLGPFAMEERGRRASMIPVLEGLGLTEEQLRRDFSQAELDAIFQQEYETSKRLETFTVPMLQSIIGLQPGVQPIIEGRQPSSISQYAGLIGPLLTATLNKGNSSTGSAGGGTFPWSGYGQSPANIRVL